MSLQTPEKVRRLQRKLYMKAKAEAPQSATRGSQSCLSFRVQFRNIGLGRSVSLASMEASTHGGPKTIESLHESVWKDVAPGQLGRHNTRVCRPADDPFLDGEQYEVELIVYADNFMPVIGRGHITASSDVNAYLAADRWIQAVVQ